MSALVCVPKARSNVESHSLWRSVTSWNSVFSLLERFAKSSRRFNMVISHSAARLIEGNQDDRHTTEKPSAERLQERKVLTKLYAINKDFVPQLN